MKQIFQGIFSGLAVFGLLVVILALLLFSFYLQLVIARSRDSLKLLLALGYSPALVEQKRITPVYSCLYHDCPYSISHHSIDAMGLSTFSNVIVLNFLHSLIG